MASSNREAQGSQRDWGNHTRAESPVRAVPGPGDSEHSSNAEESRHNRDQESHTKPLKTAPEEQPDEQDASASDAATSVAESASTPAPASGSAASAAAAAPHRPLPHLALWPNEVDCITDTVYLGCKAVNTPAWRAALGFTHVVQISAMPRPDSWEEGHAPGSLLYVQLEDDEDEADLHAETVLPAFLKFVRTLDSAVDKPQQPPRLLVHCDAGVSRSASLVIAYLMLDKGMSFDEALTFVRERRPVVQPNQGFEAQLRRMEQEGGRLLYAKATAATSTPTPTALT